MISSAVVHLNAGSVMDVTFGILLFILFKCTVNIFTGNNVYNLTSVEKKIKIM